MGSFKSKLKKEKENPQLVCLLHWYLIMFRHVIYTDLFKCNFKVVEDIMSLQKK